MSEPDFNIAETLDTVTLMRFLGTPGVPRLLSAYSRIPPGDVRDNLIRTAESIAQAYDLPPPGPMADPLLVVSSFHPTASTQDAPQLEAPKAAARGKVRTPADRTLSVEEQVVNLRMAKKYPDEIARELDVDAGWVGDVLREAREKGGLKYPKLQARTGTAPPVFHTDLKYVPNLSRSKLSGVAVSYGMSLQQLISARALFVEMRRARRPMDDIAAVTKIPEKDLWQWLYKARAAGIDLPLDVDFEDAEVRPLLPIRPAGAPIRLPSHASFEGRGIRGNGAAYKIEKAAKDRGMSVPDYEYMREVVIDLALSGMRQIEIAQAVGEPGHWVSGVLSHALRQGVPIPRAVKDEPTTEVSIAAPAYPDLAVAKLPKLDAMSKGARLMVEKAAISRNLSPEGYIEKRNLAVRLRLDGLGYVAIAARVGDTNGTVRDWCRYAESVGVTFPPVGAHQPEPLAAE